MVYPHSKSIFIKCLLKIVSPAANGNGNKMFKINGFFVILYIFNIAGK